MRLLAALVASVLLVPCAPSMAAVSAKPSLLVTNVELVELSPSHQRYGQAGDAARTVMLGHRVRAAISGASTFGVVHRLLHGPNQRQPPRSAMTCRACLVDRTRKPGAG